MVRIFCGYDPMESVGTFVFMSSVLHRSTVPVMFCPLHANELPTGTNSFTLSRFLVPWLCNFKGRAIFADAADMVCLADISSLAEELEAMTCAAKVVKHSYKTRNPMKYIGTGLESPNVDYHRKNWASLMLIDCEHDAWRNLTPYSLTNNPMIEFLQLKFIRDHDLQEIEDDGWNRLIDEGQPIDGAKILHWTAGIPAFEYYADAPGADLWRAECHRMNHPSHI